MFSSNLSHGQVESSFHNTFWNFSPNAENFSLKLQKKDQKLKVLKKTFFFIVFLWARKMQSCLSRPNNFMFFEGEPKFFCSISETDQKS